MKALITMCLLISSVTISGCAVSRALTDEPGTDVSSVRPGSDRFKVETLLGTPLREWTTAAAIHYCVYRYDGGYQGSASEASALLFLDIIGAGLPELFVLIEPDMMKPRHELRQIAVAYDRNDQVVGVFDDFSDFEELPADGIPCKGKTLPAP